MADTQKLKDMQYAKYAAMNATKDARAAQTAMEIHYENSNLANEYLIKRVLAMADVEARDRGQIMQEGLLGAMQDYVLEYQTAIEDCTVNQIASTLNFEVPNELKPNFDKVKTRKYGTAKRLLESKPRNRAATDAEIQAAITNATVEVIERYHFQAKLNHEIQRKVAKKELEEILSQAA